MLNVSGLQLQPAKGSATRLRQVEEPPCSQPQSQSVSATTN